MRGTWAITTGVAMLAASLIAPGCAGASDPGGDGAGGALSPADGSGGSTSSGGESPAGGASSDSGGDSLGGSASGGSSASGGNSTGGAQDIGVPLDGPPPPSCAELDGTECAGDDCCTSLLVPGGTATVNQVEAELPTFYLDRYEVTVARFRTYMEAAAEWLAAGNPEPGAGAHPLVPESGWRADWMTVDFESDYVPELVPTWYGFPNASNPGPAGNPTYMIEGTDELAVNHVSFFVAFAFCIWDGGRLPTEDEWQYAAHGGPNPTKFPWGDTPHIDELFATVPAGTVPSPYEDDLSWPFVSVPVGSHPESVGVLGHHDLIGGLGEFTREMAHGQSDVFMELDNDDSVYDPYDFVSLPHERLTLGLSWEGVSQQLAQTTSFLESNWARGSGTVGFGLGNLGIRCARDPDE